jgi:hypothetical protein
MSGVIPMLPHVPLWRGQEQLHHFSIVCVSHNANVFLYPYTNVWFATAVSSVESKYSYGRQNQFDVRVAFLDLFE